MLKDIQDYLKTHEAACLSDLAIHLDADPQAIQPMLEMLAARGRIRRVDAGPKSCGGCTRCLPQSLTLWEWAGD